MITPQWIQNDDVRSFVPLEILKHLNKARSRKLTWALCCAFLPRAADEGLTMPLASIWNLSYIVLDIELMLASRFATPLLLGRIIILHLTLL